MYKNDFGFMYICIYPEECIRKFLKKLHNSLSTWDEKYHKKLSICGKTKFGVIIILKDSKNQWLYSLYPQKYLLQEFIKNVSYRANLPRNMNKFRKMGYLGGF